jgi:hypothetical protein
LVQVATEHVQARSLEEEEEEEEEEEFLFL